jgi:hypothetical protein
MHIEVIRFGVVQGDMLITREAAEKAVEKLKARGTLKVDGIERAVRDVSIEYDADDESKGSVIVFL